MLGVEAVMPGEVSVRTAARREGLWRRWARIQKDTLCMFPLILGGDVSMASWWSGVRGIW